MTLGEGFFLRGKTFFEIHNYHPDWKTTLQKIEIQKKKLNVMLLYLQTFDKLLIIQGSRV